MSSKRAIRRRQCSGKVRHADAPAAFAAISSLNRSGLNPLRSMGAYRCPFCKGYHVGHRKGSGLRAS